MRVYMYVDKSLYTYVYMFDFWKSQLSLSLSVNLIFYESIVKLNGKGSCFMLIFFYP